MPERVIVFDVWGDYAHFRKTYSTSSPLTYSFPPRTAISGMIGAIAGLDKSDYFREFFRDSALIACRIMNPIKKVRIGENLIDTKMAIKMHLIRNRTQIRFEFVKDPRYRIYFWHSDEKFHRNVKETLADHQSVYTPCLGLSELVCNFQYIGEFERRALGADQEFLEIDSVVPGKSIQETDFEDGKEYFSEVMPCEMGEEREVTDYGEILFERNGKSIRARAEGLWQIESGEDGEDGRAGERIIFI
jgi:CRISPR-associated protein Cas5h